MKSITATKVREDIYIPNMRKSIKKGLDTPLDECDEVLRMWTHYE